MFNSAQCNPKWPTYRSSLTHPLKHVPQRTV